MNEKGDLETLLLSSIAFFPAFLMKVALCLFYHYDVLKDIALVIVLRHYDTVIVENYLDNYKRRSEVFKNAKNETDLKPPFYLEVNQVWIALVHDINSFKLSRGACISRFVLFLRKLQESPQDLLSVKA